MLSNNRIPWSNTVYNKKALNVLSKMANNLLDGDPLKQYLLETIEQLKNKLNSPLDIHKEVTQQDNCLVQDKNIVTDFHKIPTNLVNVSGVYILYHIQTNCFYIGSASSIGSRLRQHVVNSSRPYRGGNSKLYTYVKNNGGWGKMEGQPILITPNHLLEFLKKNPSYKLSLNGIYMLRSLTQFEIRVIEQALISHFSPILNSSHSIIYSFINWTSNYTPTLQNNVRIKVFSASNGPINNSTIIDKVGIITEFDSIANAAIGLGVSKTTIGRYINTISPLASPLLELDVFIVDVSRPLTNNAVIFEDTTLLSPITDFDLYSLPMGKLIALNSNKDPVNYYGIYNSPANAALALDNKTEYKYISRYINLERPVEVTTNKDLVYFVMNPLYKNSPSLRRTPIVSRNTKAIVLVDTINNTATHYESVKLLLQDLGIKSTGATSFVKRYMNPIKLYKNQYQFVYAKEYKGISISNYRK